MISADAVRGYVDLFVLTVVRSDASYAYELVRRISDIAGTEYTIKQTTLYSAVKRLEASGLLESFPGASETGKARTYYRATELGRAHLTEKITEWQDTKSIVDRFVEGNIE